MKPYVKKFVVEKIKEYNDKLKEKEINENKIVKLKGPFKSTEGYLYENEQGIELDFFELVGKNNYWMRLDFREVESTYGIIKNAHGRVGVVGLGLGFTVQEMAKRKEVKEIIVYELEKDIIDLYLNNFGENEKIKIINEDAFKVKGETFDYFYVDIYEYKLTEKVVEDYKHFMKAHKITDYVFWGVEHFLLSCRYEEIVWVYIPELWMDLSKHIFVSLQESGYLKWYKQLNGSLVSKILEEFKEELNK